MSRNRKNWLIDERSVKGRLSMVAGAVASSFSTGLIMALCLFSTLSSGAARAELPELNDKTFKKEVTESKVPVLVDFFATWCLPCKRMAPFVEEIATEYGGKVKFVRVDVEKAPKTAAQYDVEQMPVLFVFMPGTKSPATMTGFKDKEQIKAFIERALAAKGKAR
ncbi:MAG TPA: thioredoxin [Candidatus Obscuribacter sp.]|nr:thioredoxin [Candidatus Obscuribacter sp.]MBL8085594.1 thioredoxin [Candidatus Obscuribacter sp.]HNB14186.1 thioredoxin [Candidatus Obscuribacter sp.]HND67047.1 thioredoxin [Candidatus Obscuribacter sp.]